MGNETIHAECNAIKKFLKQCNVAFNTKEIRWLEKQCFLWGKKDK